MIKKYLRKPFIIIVIILIFSIAFSIILYSILYRLDQIIDLEIVKAVASLLMAFFTVIAVFIAIYIPKEDRIVASKIELFEFRFQLYYALENCFKTIYLLGNDTKMSPTLDKHLSQLSFLICEDDIVKILDILDSVTIKGEEKNVEGNSLKAIEQELNELRIIFKKYLQMSDFGIKDVD
jgi:hypothetical protein